MLSRGVLARIATVAFLIATFAPGPLLAEEGTFATVDLDLGHNAGPFDAASLTSELENILARFAKSKASSHGRRLRQAGEVTFGTGASAADTARKIVGYILSNDAQLLVDAAPEMQPPVDEAMEDDTGPSIWFAPAKVFQPAFLSKLLTGRWHGMDEAELQLSDVDTTHAFGNSQTLDSFKRFWMEVMQPVNRFLDSDVLEGRMMEDDTLNYVDLPDQKSLGQQFASLASVGQLVDDESAAMFDEHMQVAPDSDEFLPRRFGVNGERPAKVGCRKHHMSAYSTSNLIPRQVDELYRSYAVADLEAQRQEINRLLSTVPSEREVLPQAQRGFATAGSLPAVREVLPQAAHGFVTAGSVPEVGYYNQQQQQPQPFGVFNRPDPPQRFPSVLHPGAIARSLPSTSAVQHQSGTAGWAGTTGSAAYNVDQPAFMTNHGPLDWQPRGLPTRWENLEAHIGDAVAAKLRSGHFVDHAVDVEPYVSQVDRAAAGGGAEVDGDDFWKNLPTIVAGAGNRGEAPLDMEVKEPALMNNEPAQVSGVWDTYADDDESVDGVVSGYAEDDDQYEEFPIDLIDVSVAISNDETVVRLVLRTSINQGDFQEAIVSLDRYMGAHVGAPEFPFTGMTVVSTMPISVHTTIIHETTMSVDMVTEPRWLAEPFHDLPAVWQLSVDGPAVVTMLALTLPLITLAAAVLVGIMRARSMRPSNNNNNGVDRYGEFDDEALTMPILSAAHEAGCAEHKVRS